MSESTALTTVEVGRVELGTIRADNPADMVKGASEAANALAGVIESKKLYSMITGKRYVRCEGWTTLATMMGCLPREVSCEKQSDGGYVAVVELVRMTDGFVMTRASAECGMDERTWSGRDAYARRSMAITRATSKACRIAFSWVMTLAGYEVTPAEEIPHEPPVVVLTAEQRADITAKAKAKKIPKAVLESMSQQTELMANRYEAMLEKIAQYGEPAPLDRMPPGVEEEEAEPSPVKGSIEPDAMVRARDALDGMTPSQMRVKVMQAAAAEKIGEAQLAQLIAGTCGGDTLATLKLTDDFARVLLAIAANSQRTLALA